MAKTPPLRHRVFLYKYINMHPSIKYMNHKIITYNHNVPDKEVYSALMT